MLFPLSELDLEAKTGSDSSSHLSMLTERDARCNATSSARPRGACADSLDSEESHDAGG